MDIDDILEAEDFGRATLTRLADRLRASTTLEQFIYRETELDEVWRLVDVAMSAAETSAERLRLAALREAVVTAHDMVGIEHRPVAAASRLGEAVLAGLAG